MATRMIKTDLLNEVPRSLFFTYRWRLPTVLWMIAGRLPWYFNNKKQVETIPATSARIANYVDFLKAKNSDSTISAHAFYFAELANEIKRREATSTKDRRINNGENRTFLLVKRVSQELSR